MSNSTAQNSDINKIRLNRYGVRGIVREIIGSFIHLAVLLISAAKVGWINAWNCLDIRGIQKLHVIV